MPDLGKYALTVLSAYGATIALLVGFVALTLAQSRRARRLLAEAEARQKPGQGAEHD